MGVAVLYEKDFFAVWVVVIYDTFKFVVAVKVDRVFVRLG